MRGHERGLVRDSVQGEHMATSVGEDFPKQQERVRRLQQFGREIGPAGAFYVAVCEHALKQAETAAMSGDPVAILMAYKALAEIEE